MRFVGHGSQWFEAGRYFFVAGLAMGFVECLKITRDTFADEGDEMDAEQLK